MQSVMQMFVARFASLSGMSSREIQGFLHSRWPVEMTMYGVVKML